LLGLVQGNDMMCAGIDRLDIVVLVIIDSWAKLKYPHPFFYRALLETRSASLLLYISVNTASAVILTLGSYRAYLFWLFPTQAVWLTVVLALKYRAKSVFFYHFSSVRDITTQYSHHMPIV
jgi:hypothetical protein